MNAEGTKATTLCFLMKEGEVLLAMKKRGFGAGKWNGVGGKVKEGENIAATAVREVKEEIGVDVLPGDLVPAGTLYFRFQNNPSWNNDCSVFLVRKWQHDPSESEEMRPQWHTVGSLPFDQMWVDDPLWLPRVLGGEKIRGEFLFDSKGETVIEHIVRGEK